MEPIGIHDLAAPIASTSEPMVQCLSKPQSMVSTVHVRISYAVMQAVLGLAKPMDHPTLASSIQRCMHKEDIQVTPIHKCGQQATQS